ncbi:MAG: glucose/galactose MFS transporter [Cellvibrionales bacterium]|nr:glucose/galactose MFS transporter [Cellvibrionales bacterium]|tara:strand:+ start:446 stop:1675 length:1230 start_codon:yes stop_codon:yes gene_type:complete
MSDAHSVQSNNDNYGFALVSLTSLFFMWGLITSLNDVLIPRLKAVFDLSYTEAMMIQFCFFFAYFVVSLPAGSLIKRIGYKSGVVVGLIIAGIGCACFYPAAAYESYNYFLAALFVLASGITILQVAANPYVTALGNPITASSRLTLTQAFNSLGTTVGPWLGGILILTSATSAVESTITDASSVQMPYLVLAATLILMSVIFAMLKLPEIEDEETTESADIEGSAWNYSHLVLGAVAIFVYVGAEVSIGSFLINFLGEESIAGLEEMEAAKYVSFYWAGAMVGRFIGAAAMQKIAAGKALAFNAVAASILVSITVFSSGVLAMWAILLVGLFNSIMFPTIFSLGVAGLGAHTSQGSGILCLAIVGGALLPLLQGLLADTYGVQNAFALAIVCYAYIAYYGLKGSKIKS